MQRLWRRRQRQGNLPIVPAQALAAEALPRDRASRQRSASYTFSAQFHFLVREPDLGAKESLFSLEARLMQLKLAKLVGVVAMLLLAMEFKAFPQTRAPGGSAEDCIDRGLEHLDREQWSQAVQEFSQALRLDPNNVDAYYHRAEARMEQGQNRLALEDLNAALRLAPQDADALYLRGVLHEDAREYRQALADYQQAARLDPEDWESLNNVAWLLAAAPQAELRDGQRAVTAARRAVQLDSAENWELLDTLAAALAETGQFALAVQFETEALKRAPDEDQAELRARLKLFQAQKPFRLPAAD